MHTYLHEYIHRLYNVKMYVLCKDTHRDNKNKRSTEKISNMPNVSNGFSLNPKLNLRGTPLFRFDKLRYGLLTVATLKLLFLCFLL